ncbi:MAG TPA: Flp pilus assembly protein CpaB [Gemmatimonadota bacterium]|nr:Flp pilus assembly protein CpaB [Gemmatimonadota bacterium]
MALVLALVSGGAAGYLALNYLRQPVMPLVAKSTQTTQVAVAARALALGSVVGPADVKLVDWPATNVPPGYSSAVQEVVGRGLITAVAANEPLLDAKLATKEAGGGLPIVIPEGMRAVSVKVDEVIGVAGFVLPGTRVDVLVTLNPPSDNEATITRVILQNVLTLAAGQTIQRDRDGEPQTVTVITLLVGPEDAEKLTLAATEGQIHLALRNTLDMALVETSGVREASLVRSTAPQPTPSPSRVRRAPVQREGQSVVTYNGTERTVTTF